MTTVRKFEIPPPSQVVQQMTILGNISEGKRVLNIPQGQSLFSQGDRAAALYFVQSGRVKISVVSDEGKEAVLAIVGPHSFLGEDCLNPDSVRLTSAMALEPLTVIQVEKRAMLRALRTQPELSERFMATLLKRVADLEEDLCDQLFNQSEKRLARVLLKLAHLADESEGTVDALIPTLSHEMLAEMVGTTRSRVTHFMNKFRKMDLIEYDGHPNENGGGLRVRASRLNDAIIQDRI